MTFVDSMANGVCVNNVAVVNGVISGSAMTTCNGTTNKIGMIFAGPGCAPAKKQADSTSVAAINTACTQDANGMVIQNVCSSNGAGAAAVGAAAVLAAVLSVVSAFRA